MSINDIHTSTGKLINPLDPNPDLIDIRDIAHALSMQARWNGHARDFYSVAEHSVRVSLISPAKDALYGLLHDAPEAYLSDIPGPIKKAEGFAFYREAEDRLMAVIAARFGLPAKIPASVHRADAILLHTEARDLFPAAHNKEWVDMTLTQPRRINPITTPAAAREWFLERFRTLDKRRKAAEAAA